MISSKPEPRVLWCPRQGSLSREEAREVVSVSEKWNVILYLLTAQPSFSRTA